VLTVLDVDICHNEVLVFPFVTIMFLFFFFLKFIHLASLRL